MSEKNGHAETDDPMRGKRGPRFALMPVDVLKVRALHREGWSPGRIGKRYGVRRWCIQDVLGQRRAYHPGSWVMQAAERLDREYDKSLVRPWWASERPKG